MKTRKRLVSLVLSLLMLFSLGISAYAAPASESPDKPAYTFYVPMGTSITGGYRLPGDGTGGTVGKPDGVFSNEYTYAYLVGKEFDIEGHYSGALLGTRTLEYRMLLEEDFSEDNVDNYNNIWVGPRCGNNYNRLHNQLGPVYREKLAQADLITVEIGLNDVTSYAMCTLMTELEEKVNAAKETDPNVRDIFSYLQSLGGNGMPDDSGDMLSLITLATYFAPYEEIIAQLLEYFNEGRESFRSNFGIVLKDIRALNSDADIFVVGCYNPLGYMLDHEITANENGNIDIKNLILSTGETLGLTDEQIIYIFQLMEEYVVGEQNLIMQAACCQSDATFVDVRGIDLSGSPDGTHPYVAGHAYIAEHIVNAVYGLYPCQHRHLTTRGAIRPTILTLGYTGNIYCTDCGHRIEVGRPITYMEYIEQQEAGDVPPADAYEEEVDPIVAPPAGDPIAHEGYDVLAFTSDVHNKTGNVSAARLASWFGAVQSKIGAIDFFGANGDYADGNGSAVGDAYWNLAKTTVDVVKATDEKNAALGFPFDWVLTTGNHEHQHGSYSTTANAVRNDIQMTGEAKVADGANYRVYCFGATQSEYAFTDAAIAELDAYLSTAPHDCPVIVLSHFPLHEQGSRAITGEEKVIEVLNKYPNVIFLWGHNHTDANNSEKYYDNVFTETINETPINFTYAAAGCMSDSENNSGSAAVKGKGLVIKVDDGMVNDNIVPKVTMQYVDATAGATSSVYSIDITGHGVKEAEASAIQGEYAYKKVSTPKDGGQYIVAYNDGGKYVALDLTKCGGYTNNSSYRYNGYKGSPVTVTNNSGLEVTGSVTSDMVWQFAKDGSKWTIQNVLTGKYLNASYVDGKTSSTKDGSIYLANTKDTWSLSGDQLKSTAADKTLAFDKIDDITRPFTGAYDFFTVRSTGDKLVFFEVTGNPVAMGTPAPDEEPGAIELDGKSLVIAYANRALGVTANSGYKTGTDVYSGINANTISFNEDGGIAADSLTTASLWKFEKAGNNQYRIKNAYSGQYLGSTYTETTSGSWWSRVTNRDGKLFLTSDSSYLWSYNGSALTAAKSNANLSFETPENVSGNYEGSLYFFTVRSNGSDIRVYQPEAELPAPSDAQMLGKCTAWKQTDIGNATFCVTINGYAIGLDAGKGFTTVKLSNESQLAELGSRYQWKIAAADGGYTLQNVGNAGCYLGAYTETNLLSTKASPAVVNNPYVWQFSSGNLLSITVKTRGFLNLSVPNNYNLTCANGLLSLTLGSSSADAAVKLYQSVKIADEHTALETTEIPATCTELGSRTVRCADCGASYTVAIPAAGHFDENTDHKCDICGFSLEEGSGTPGSASEPTQPAVIKHAVVVDGEITKYYAEGETVTVTAGTKPNARFNRWAIDGVNVPDNTKNPLTFVMGTKDVTLSSKWDYQHKVTVDGSAKYYFPGETVTVKAGTKNGYTFTNWTLSKYNDLGLSNEQLAQAELSFTMGERDVTFTSNWEKNPTYTVRFVSNGGTAYDALTVDPGTVVQLSGYKPTKNGYTFQGWYLDEGLTRSAGSSVTVTDNVTLYASWTATSALSSTISGMVTGTQQFLRSLFRR